MLTRLDAGLDRLSRLAYGSAAIALLAILGLMLLRIASRNLGWGLNGLQLYAQALGVWMVFIVAGALGWEQRHIEIDYLSSRLPERAARAHSLLVAVVNICLCVFLVLGSVLAAQQYWRGTSPSVGIPLPLYYIPVGLGVTMLMIVYLRRMLP